MASKNTQQVIDIGDIPESRPQVSDRILLRETDIAGRMALGLLVIFGVYAFVFSCAAMFLALLGPIFPASATAIDAMATVLPFLATPLGVVIGYYFSEKRRSD